MAMQKQMIDAEAMVNTNKLLVSLYSMGEHNESDMGICDCKYTIVFDSIDIVRIWDKLYKYLASFSVQDEIGRLKAPVARFQVLRSI